MTGPSSSKRWKSRQAKDPYVRRARTEGYRSRAVYKLIDIQQRHKLSRPGAKVCDLGAAPGGWSQLAAAVAGPKGKIVAVDLLPIEPIDGVDVIQGDFREEATLKRIEAAIGPQGGSPRCR